MDTTNSLSSGRHTRYSPPAVEGTLKPSSRPIRSSWAIAPLFVKNCLPASRQMLCRRPLASVSRTHSPDASGPRWTPDQPGDASSAPCSGEAESMAGSLSSKGTGSAPGREGALDVGGGEDPVDASVGLDQQVLRGRGARHRLDQLLTGAVGRQPHAVLDAAGALAARQPRATPGRDRLRPGLLHE